MGDYQQARITLHSNAVSEDTDASLRFKFIKSTTGAKYYQSNASLYSQPEAVIYDIPQGIKLDALGFENLWNDSNNNWGEDTSCVIDKIEFIKDDSLIDEDFNVVTKTDTTYTVKNPALQNIANTEINKNMVKFDALQAYEASGQTKTYTYSAAYWEFEDLSSYSTITFKLKRENESQIADRLIIRGYTPFDYTKNQMSKTSTVPDTQEEPYYQVITNDSITVTAELSKFKTDLDVFTAISFQYNSFENAVPFDVWVLEVEEISLSK